MIVKPTNPEVLQADILLPLDAFVRSIGVKRGASHALFLGAGASISSGIPSAQSCIWEWKRNLFLTNNPGLEDQFAELSLSSVQRRIQDWLNAQGTYPPEGANEEYGFYIRECFPIADDRRAYFQDKVRCAKPHIGYCLLSRLAQADLIRTVWSTNFDGLPARAAANFDLTPIEVGIDTQERIARQVNAGELLCVSLHGDYRYDEIKNTSDEIQRQEEGLCHALIEEVRKRTMIVSGYSGRDASIMEALSAGYAEDGTGALYWCGYGDGDIPEPVASLITHARSHGRQAFYVPAMGFDDLMTRLSLHCLEGEQREAVRNDIAVLAPKDLLARKPYQLQEYRANTVIKSNAFNIECPREVVSFGLKTWPSEKAWSWVRKQTETRQIVAVPFKGKIHALGGIDDIRDCFGDNIEGMVEHTPVSPKELRFENGAIVALFREALVRSMAHASEFNTDGKFELWKVAPNKEVQQNNMKCLVHESVIVFLRSIGRKQYLILKPSIKVLDRNGNEAPKDVAKSVKIHILGYQHNKPFNMVMNNWRKILFAQEKPATFKFPPDSIYSFRIWRSPMFAQVGLPLGGKSVTISDKLRPLIKHKGIQLAEPTLQFCDKPGTGTNIDTLPLRGLAENRPYDYPLTLKGLAPSLRIGVICPRSEIQLLRKYLLMANQRHRPDDKERDYLVDYSGFQQVYGLPIETPEPDAPGWVNCAEPSGSDDQKRTLSVARNITAAIEALHSSFAPHVMLVFFPRRWDNLRGYRDENERFDVHDFVKAYAVQHGVATQFLNEDTLSDRQQCRVWWWLSLALYVKGMRTPWVLSGLEENTAYVGLGFSIDQNAQRGNHIILGCSHIYSARGEGLQYRLSKVENPIIRGKNPFMSRDDARRTGENIRQLFFDARMKLPQRVVLHKRTPFLAEEREGLLDGLGNVTTIDMLEIVSDNALRYVASVPGRDGRVDEDNYPVRRGTVVQIDEHKALLWVHGATTAVNPRLKYFQGKRRIPAPIMLHRHVGATSLEQLSAEILGLSKMNWNTFDLYTKFPATLQSSGEIARIGSLLQRFGATSYDYRLFI